MHHHIAFNMHAHFAECVQGDMCKRRGRARFLTLLRRPALVLLGDEVVVDVVMTLRRRLAAQNQTNQNAGPSPFLQTTRILNATNVIQYFFDYNRKETSR